uniref:STI1 domain-containing protein n=1 Tax=Heterorhabditis bacteriophora TaxID=37862 RepID=A0A1I7WK97_HETBA
MNRLKLPQFQLITAYVLDDLQITLFSSFSSFSSFSYLRNSAINTTWRPIVLLDTVCSHRVSLLISHCVVSCPRDSIFSSLLWQASTRLDYNAKHICTPLLMYYSKCKLTIFSNSAMSGNSALRNLYLSQLTGLSGGSPSPSSLPSSGPSSATGALQLETSAPEPSPKATTPVPSQADMSGLPHWFTGLLPPPIPQQQQGIPNNVNSILEHMQAMQGLHLLGGNMGALAAALNHTPVGSKEC